MNIGSACHIAKDVVIDAQSSLAAWLYLLGGVPRCEKLPVVMCFHGSGFVYSALSSIHSRFLNALVGRGRCGRRRRVRRLLPRAVAPAHPLLAAYYDAWVALGWTVVSCSASGGPEPWLVKHGNTASIFVAGNSAGANIAPD
uniref:Alpha/beta hydrolase fold-3 domain-containing protein n=1 Tax=Oryza meridionalis TaxID=40149 RepID=A0A0E0C560_9ORYZ